VSLLPHIQPQLENQRVKHYILSKSFIEFNSHHFGPLPDEKYDFGPFLTRYLTPYDQEKKISKKIFLPSFSCRFRKKKPF
jgi:hypothetical protein